MSEEKEIIEKIEKRRDKFSKEIKPFKERLQKIEDKKRYERNKKQVGKIHFLKDKDSLSKYRSITYIKSIDEKGFLSSIRISIQEYDYEETNYHSRYKKITKTEAKKMIQEILE